MNTQKIKTIAKYFSICASIALIIAALYFAEAFFGNPLSLFFARRNSVKFLNENFDGSQFEISKVAYNFKTGGYYAFIDCPDSQDSHFTIYFDGWGQYSYDTYDNVTDKSTTFQRLNDQYREFIKNRIPCENGLFDISIAFGELRESGYTEMYSYTDELGNTQYYTIKKDYGIDRSQLVLDGEYDLIALGRDFGCITLYIHDPKLSVHRAAELLLDVKDYLDAQQVPFYAIEFHLCEPRTEEGYYTGKEITLFDFLYSDIYEDGLIDRVQQHWDLAQEHYAIQDGEKNNISKNIS